MTNKSKSGDFPKGLFNWAGHRGGGVKKPFVDGSGLPVGNVIRTNLIEKIDNWVGELIDTNGDSARVLLLVGGPGNGKTEVVEYFIKKLDIELKCSGKLIDICKQAFSYTGGELPDMKEIIDCTELDSISNFYYESMEIIHDASIGDPIDIIEDIKSMKEKKKVIYIACLNRGILSQILSEVDNRNKYSNDTIELFEQILSATTLSSNQPQCWPLQDYPYINLWPMDIESLVDSEIYTSNNSPAYQIFKKALNKEQWSYLPGSCPAGEYCPFHANLEMLSKEEALCNLMRILRYYEITAEKRWTFRELFSLTPQLILGHENDYQENEMEVDPCEWAARQVEIIKSNKKELEKLKAIYRLTSKLYYHSLFPRWPDLKLKKESFNKVLKSNKKDILNPDIFFQLLSWISKHSNTNTGKIIRDQVGPMLDPAETSGSTAFITANGRLTVDELEEMFSYSARQGYNYVSNKNLSKIECDFMDWLVKMEDEVVNKASQGNKNHAKQYHEIKSIIQMFACRLVKRSLAVKNGVVKDYEYMKKYSKVTQEENKLKKVRKDFSKFINEDSYFPVSLTTTLGQPTPYPANDVIIKTLKLNTSFQLPMRGKEHANCSLPFLKIDKFDIPLTYGLFKALAEINDGLMRASFPPDTLALIEGVKAMKAGEVVRNEELLDDGVISIAGKEYDIAINEGRLFLEVQ